MSIITGYLEKKSYKCLEDFSFLFKKLLGKEQGIYALYKENILYYVGKSIDLQKRLKQHLNDRHQNKWDTFSLFVVKDKRHISDLESLLVRIYKPKGNHQIPNKGKNLQKDYKYLIDDYQREQKDMLLGEESKVPNNKKVVSIIAIYKGVKYFAKFNRSSHSVCYNKKTYSSPSAAGRAVTGKSNDGLLFWKAKDKNNQLVPIKKLFNL